MKKITLSIFLVIAFSSISLGCDVCNIYEYTNLNNRSFIGFFYRYRTFNGYAHLGNEHQFQFPTNGRTSHEPEENGLYADKTQQDYETYTTWELRGNITLKEKINFQFILPYEQNTVYYKKIIALPKPETDTTIALEGWGDLMLAADYIFQKSNGKIKHIFRPGFAINFPTGDYKKASEEGKLYDPIIQPGTGSWAWIIRANYQVIYRNTGLMASLNYQIAGKGKHNYDFANSFNFNADVFHQLFLGNLAIVPRMGTYMENASHDFFQNEKVALSGGNSWFGNIATDFNFKKWTCQIAYQIPFSESLNGNQLGNAGRFNFGIIKGF